MSDEEEESLSEGFSASEDEWKPAKDARGGESSDDDDSDFEEVATTGAAASNSGRSSAGATRKSEQKAPSGIKGASVKKRKPSGQSLRSKLYNKYRPPPKTFTTSPSQNSPSASGSNRATASKNAKTPNEDNADSSSESSVDDYLVNPAELDLRSSFFTAPPAKDKSPAPEFDCNAGITNLTDSGSEDNNESSIEDNATKAFDFRSLLENANSLERTKDAMAKRAVTATPGTPAGGAKDAKAATMDVNALLALGENQNYANEPEEDERPAPPPIDGPSRLSKTKSTRIKRHTKTRPASTVVAGVDTDDSDWEEVAGDAEDQSLNDDATPNVSGDLEIHVGLPSGPARNQKRTQHDLELALKRRMNRDIKDRQLLLHKVSLMCLIARSYKYNKLLSNTNLMQETLKLLPSKNAYPTERGTELKYLQSFATWFKTAFKLLSPNLYPDKTPKSSNAIVEELLAQIKRKEARCKQDMIFIFIVLARGMGMHCRLIVNMQPMPLRPAASDLIPIKLKQDDADKSKNQSVEADDNDETEEEDDQKLKKTNKQKSTIKAKTATSEASKVAVKSSSNKKANEKQTEKASSSSKSKADKTHEQKPARSRTAQDKLEDKPHSSSPKAKSNPSRSQAAKNKLEDKPQPTSLTAKEIPSRSRAAQKKTESNYIKTEEKPSTSRSRDCDAHSSAESRPKLSRLKREAAVPKDSPERAAAPSKKSKIASQKNLQAVMSTPIARRTRKASADKPEEKSKLPTVQIGSPVIPKLVLQITKSHNTKHSDAVKAKPKIQLQQETDARSRSKSPKVRISAAFLKNKDEVEPAVTTPKERAITPNAKIKISPTFLKAKSQERETVENQAPARQLRTRQQKGNAAKSSQLSIPQLDGADDSLPAPKKRPKLEKLQKSHSKGDSDEDFEPSPSKAVKKSPMLPKAVQQLRKDRRVLSTDDEAADAKEKRKATASDMWVEVWSEVEEQWICIDLFKGKLHCLDTIRKAASPNLAYVYAFQDDLSLKDVTARYCTSWTTIVRKGRVDSAWLEDTITPYLGRRTKRDIVENQQLRRIHEEKPMPTSISDFKDHPLYALERHLLKFQALYPPDAPTLGFIRSEPIYARECVHTLHSREIWLKSARVVKLGEQPYKIVKARPKWDRLTRTVIKDQPLEIFGYWQTQDYEPPTAENGMVPRNAYGNVELFKACMLPKKTVHLRLPGLMRVCKKLNIDCANAVVGFDFHQGACHPMYDGFIICEEFEEAVTDAWHQDQQEQLRKEREKYETRVYGNWKKLIKGLLIRERLKKKYNF